MKYENERTLTNSFRVSFQLHNFDFRIKKLSHFDGIEQAQDFQ